MNRIEEIHMSLVNGQRRQMVEQIKKYCKYDFFADYKAYLQELYGIDACFEYFTDCVISYNRITNR